MHALELVQLKLAAVPAVALLSEKLVAHISLDYGFPTLAVEQSRTAVSARRAEEVADISNQSVCEDARGFEGTCVALFSQDAGVAVEGADEGAGVLAGGAACGDEVFAVSTCPAM